MKDYANFRDTNQANEAENPAGLFGYFLTEKHKSRPLSRLH